MDFPRSEAAPRRRAARSDAIRNRNRILDAAQRVFAEHGIDAPLDVVAREAGIGPATLYRHFPNRNALLVGIHAAVNDRVAESAERALDEPDAWTGLAEFLERATDVLQSGPSLLAIGRRLAEEGIQARSDERAHGAIDQIVARAKEAGAVREEVTATDVALIPHALRELGADDAWARPFAFVLTGLRPAEGEPVEPRRGPLSAEEYAGLFRG